MKYSKYPMKVDDAHTKYEFISEGPRGKILKAVIYGQIEEDLFNLAFGSQQPLSISRIGFPMSLYILRAVHPQGQGYTKWGLQTILKR
jgi:hypothetical protein